MKIASRRQVTPVVYAVHAMPKANINHCPNLLLWLVTGAIIGGLVSKIGGYTFQHHVRVFYPDGMAYSEPMQAVAALGLALRPIGWFGSLLAPIYYCFRHNIPCKYLVLFSIGGAVLAFLASVKVNASPGPHYHTSEINVPISVFIGCAIGIFTQASRSDRISKPRK